MNSRAGFRILNKGLLVAALLLALITLIPAHARGQTEGQRRFTTAKEAIDALISALRSASDSELTAILGSGSEQIVSSGDEVADKATREQFVALYELKHSVLSTGSNHLTLNVGKDDWPFPVPLVRANGKWYFDGPAGKQEILYRRIGRNELAAIQVCKGFVSAQREYAATGHDGEASGSFAQRLISEPGKQNGLYWEIGEGETPSPAGPFLARASAEGYNTSGQPTPYHGYYYRILKAQGASARGGAKSYLVDSKMTRGFALIAFPAEYRSGGVMTFIVNQSGIIYQKDLGVDTQKIASSTAEYNPDKSWRPVK